ncbi:general secretion pathway protein K [Methylophaga aminisulfidivorans MP]|uniref:General secretion pathway protein K n=1 Tax=Methylophaga aminisulfidivorans MP TaxID=1026882 RepID=F5SUW9_9GAMM|nr:PilN domain-containing protein [Methylophaga aminisulfidivorans]EGL55555.1 general secretion pathway protein K [Methylophaga aminisulfidivorans MP]
MFWQQLRQGIASAWKWWLSQLNAGLPKRWQYQTDIRRRRLCISFHEDRYQLTLWSKAGDDIRWQATTKRADKLTLPKKTSPNKSVLLLDEQQVLSRQLTIPRSAKHNIAELLCFEMDKFTPFQAEQVSFDWVELEEQDDPELIQLRLFVMLREDIEQHQQRLKPLGISIDRVSVQDSLYRDRVNLLGSLSSKNAWSAYVWPASALVCLLCALYLPLSFYETQLQQQQKSLTALRTKAMHDVKKQQHGEYTLAQFRELAEQQRQQQWLAVLNTLSEVLPKDTWVRRFQVRDNTIEIQGVSTSATTLLSLLAKTKQFTDVTFKAPVTFDKQLGKERLFITMKRATDAS